MRAASLALLNLLLQACFVSPLQDADTLWVTASVYTEGHTGTRRSATTLNPWDNSGLFQLEQFPKYVRVAVETEGYELASATWPDKSSGVGQGEGPTGEVEVTLQVAAGSKRRLRALGFFKEPQQVMVYSEDSIRYLDLVAGTEVEESVHLARHESGTVEAVVRCTGGTVEPWEPYQAALIDARAEVVHVPIALTQDSLGALIYRSRGVPVGRPHRVRVFLRLKTDTKKTKVCDMLSDTFSLAEPNETKAVSLVVPCTEPCLH